MKHAGAASLDTLEPMLERLRAHGQLVEKKRGIFYRKAKAFLHFHEDPEGLFCDVRLDMDADFKRFPVTTVEQQKQVLQYVADSLS